MNSRRLIIAGILSVAAPFNVAAAPDRPLGNDGLINMPVCVDRYGENVTYLAVSGHELSEHRVQIAIAARLNGKPVIAYDSARLAHTPPEFQNFVIAHECAHHQLGHVGMMRSDTNENAADCAGILDLKNRRHYGLPEIKIIADTDEKLLPRLRPGQQGIGWSAPDRRAILTACLSRG